MFVTQVNTFFLEFFFLIFFFFIWIQGFLGVCFVKEIQTLAGRKGDLGVLKSAGLFILDMENLRVNATVLGLNLTSNTFKDNWKAKYEEVKQLKATDAE